MYRYGKTSNFYPKFTKSLIHSTLRDFILKKMGTGEITYDLRKKIQQIQSELNQLGDSIVDVPELIDSANLLRTNEFLSKTNEKKTELISVFVQYSDTLEELLGTVFEIQKDLKDILQEQSSMLFKSKSIRCVSLLGLQSRPS